VADLPREVKNRVVQNMVSQGPFVFVSFKGSHPSVVWDQVRPMDWVEVYKTLAEISGIELSTNVTAQLKKQASVLHNHQIAEEIG
jgi:phage gp37-like protein